MTWRSSTTSSRSSSVRTATVLPEDLDRLGVEGPSALRMDDDPVNGRGDKRAAPVEAGVIVPSLLRRLVSERDQDRVADPLCAAALRLLDPHFHARLEPKVLGLADGVVRVVVAEFGHLRLAALDLLSVLGI